MSRATFLSGWKSELFRLCWCLSRCAARVEAQRGTTEMKRYGVVAGALTGVAALAGAGVLFLGGAAQSNAAEQGAAITFTMRNFEKMSNGKYISHSKLPKTWKESSLGKHETKFDDAANGRMIRFNTWLGPASAKSQLDKKIASLKGTPGLKIVAKATVKGASTVGQGPVT